MLSLFKKIFNPGDKRVVYNFCKHCRGQGCIFFTKEQLDEGVGPKMVMTMDAKLSACRASIDSHHRNMSKQPWFKQLTQLVKEGRA